MALQIYCRAILRAVFYEKNNIINQYFSIYFMPS
ncbi:hypothetical protein BAPKO_3031 (plasmid) [Borreliella afzelii PKo]|nr:hypothetical protein BAPKO_3031 [Borreliella afzelii PKo]